MTIQEKIIMELSDKMLNIAYMYHDEQITSQYMQDLFMGLAAETVAKITNK